MHPVYGDKHFTRLAMRSVKSDCLFVRALTGKWLGLSIPNLVHIYSIAVTQQALIKVKVQGHTVTKNITVTLLLVTMSCIPHTNMPLCYMWPLPAWVCMWIRLPMFSSLD